MPRRNLAIALAIMASPACADSSPHMGDWGSGYGPGMMLVPVLWLAVLGVVIVGVTWGILRLLAQSPHPKASDAQRELDLRLARGDITVEEHAARRKALLG